MKEFMSVTEIENLYKKVTKLIKKIKGTIIFHTIFDFFNWLINFSEESWRTVEESSGKKCRLALSNTIFDKISYQQSFGGIRRISA
jgi:hypothetical protein